VHVVEYLGESWRVGLALRAALCDDLELRAKYTEAKERAIAASPVGRVRYNELKEPFLSTVKAGLK